MKPRILISRSESSAAECYVAAMYEVGVIADSVYAPSSSEGYDGLILAGGGDVDPALYGEAVNGSDGIDRFRDDAEWRLCDRFIREGKPIMGICRGHQFLNVYFGGTLIQHLPSFEIHRKDGDARIHSTRTEEGSLAYRLFGGAPTVNSIHHQAVKTLGRGLIATQFCTDDGTVEAAEHESLPIISFQWHPERICLGRKREDAVDALPIFEYFASLLN